MHRIPLYAAWLMAAIVAAGTVRYASFTAWGTDPASYLSAAHQWASGELYEPNAFHMWEPPLSIGLPLGSRHSTISGTHVTMYPLGFPLLLAAGELADADLGAYVVTPLFAGILVVATFFVARRVTDDWAALIAGGLVAMSPIVLGHSVIPMSDVPATAFLMLGIAMSVRPSLAAAMAAGACVAFAVMTRPVFAPLALVPFVLVLLETSQARWRRVTLYLVFAAIGPAMLAWSQWVLYGNPLTPGYSQFEIFFNRDRIAVNAEVYIRNLRLVYTPLIFAGFFAALPLYYARGERDAARLRTIVCLMLLAAINYAVYLPYLTYDDVGFTRFMLPLHGALVTLLASSIGDAAALAARLWKPLAAICVLPAIVIGYQGTKLYGLVWYAYVGQSQVRLMGKYLREALPRNAAVISFLHSGAVAHYTGAEIVRYDFMPRGREAERLIERLERRGYRPVFVLDQENETANYKMALQGTPFERMEWRARANFQNPGSSTIWYVDGTDRFDPERVKVTDWVRAPQK